MPSESVSVMVLDSSGRDSQIEKIMNTFSHPKAQLHLRMAGVNRAQLRESLSKLDNAQLAMVARRADTVKTAGQLEILIVLLVIAILVVIFLYAAGKDIEIKDKNK